MYNRAHLITGAGPETPTWGLAAAVAAQAGTAFTWGSHTTLHVCDSYHGRLHSDCGFGFLPGSLLKPHPSQILLPPTTKVWVGSGFEDLRGQAWEVQFISPQPATLSPGEDRGCGGTKSLGCKFADAMFGCHTNICLPRS